MVELLIGVIGLIMIITFAGVAIVGYTQNPNCFKEANDYANTVQKNNLNKNLKSEGRVVCPNCGSTQIQLVNKKWSLMTGFFTNKVDRVCVACKKKF